MCPLVVLDRIATWASNAGSEIVHVLLGDSLPLDSCSLEWQKRDFVIGSTRTSGLSTVHLPSVILQDTPITLSMASMSHLLRGSDLRIPQVLNTPSAFPMKHSAPLLRIPSHIQYLYLVFILFIGSVVIYFANSFSPNGTNSCVGFLPCSPWFLRDALNVTLDGSDDPRSR